MIDADLIVHESISNPIHEIGHDPDIIVISCVTSSFDTSQYRSELALDLTKGTRTESVQDQMSD